MTAKAPECCGAVLYHEQNRKGRGRSGYCLTAEWTPGTTGFCGRLAITD